MLSIRLADTGLQPVNHNFEIVTCPIMRTHGDCKKFVEKLAFMTHFKSLKLLDPSLPLINLLRDLPKDRLKRPLVLIIEKDSPIAAHLGLMPSKRAPLLLRDYRWYKTNFYRTYPSASESFKVLTSSPKYYGYYRQASR